ncbi:hypothetical protein OESDEN_05859 [Oesophagostomum dentatum]|uniref:Uncharacterized protein n=1 Tax=Oesophagostomum dentatum TaxID=61180 RepID=A0A0B1TFQ6_OESDE|nr:hypothetical protein OESDEN_05859 [Oesophagostomum dentatum]
MYSWAWAYSCVLLTDCFSMQRNLSCPEIGLLYLAKTRLYLVGLNATTTSIDQLANVISPIITGVNAFFPKILRSKNFSRE